MSKWHVYFGYHSRMWCVDDPSGRYLRHRFATWREAFDYADNKIRYQHLERQYLSGMAEARLSPRHGPEELT